MTTDGLEGIVVKAKYPRMCALEPMTTSISAIASRTTGLLEMNATYNPAQDAYRILHESLMRASTQERMFVIGERHPKNGKFSEAKTHNSFSPSPFPAPCQPVPQHAIT